MNRKDFQCEKSNHGLVVVRNLKRNSILNYFSYNNNCVIFILFVLMGWLLTGCSSSAFTVLDANNNKFIVIDTQNDYIEEILCIQSDTIYTIHMNYDNKIACLSTWSLKGDHILSDEFVFNHSSFMFQRESTAYNPELNRLYYTLKSKHKNAIFEYDLNTDVEKIIYNEYALSLEIIDKDHIIFIQNENIKQNKKSFLKMLNISNGEIVYSLKLGDGMYKIGALSHNKEKVVVQGAKACLVSLKNKKVEENFNAAIYGIQPVVWSKDDEKIYYINQINQPRMQEVLICYNTNKNEIDWEYSPHHLNGFLCVYDENTLLYTSFDKKSNRCIMHMFDIRTQKEVKSWKFFSISSIYSSAPHIVTGNLY